MTGYILMAVVFVAWMSAWWFCERRRRTRLNRRRPVIWREIADREFVESSERTAVDIVVKTVAQSFRIPQSQIYPDDDITVDYSYPTFWCMVIPDDPVGLVIETIRENIEQDYAPWDWDPATCGPRVRDIIADVSRHLKACACEDARSEGQT